MLEQQGLAVPHRTLPLWQLNLPCSRWRIEERAAWGDPAPNPIRAAGSFSNLHLINQIPAYSWCCFHSFIHSFIPQSTHHAVSGKPSLPSGLTVLSARTPLSLLSYQPPHMGMEGPESAHHPRRRWSLCFPFTSPGLTEVTQLHRSTGITGAYETGPELQNSQGASGPGPC